MSDIGTYSSSQKIVVKAGGSRVSVVKSGPMGARGPAGPPGASGEGAVFEYTQASASSSWVINHNLGVYPVFDAIEATTGLELWPGVIHHSLNQVELTFLTPRAGTARLRS